MIVHIARIAVALPLLLAPYQCARSRGPEFSREETAGDALWALAEKFDAEGDNSARERTLRFLAERYPSNRHASEARSIVGDLTPAP